MTIDTTGVVEATHPWMETYLGIKFCPTNPRECDVYIEDIAHSLSMQCRYAGHCTEFYSVAQHSVLASRIGPDETALERLMHDSPEAYLQDMIRPLKCTPLGDLYATYEHRMMEVIANKYKLTYPFTPDIKHADNVMLFTEQRDLRLKQLYWQGSETYKDQLLPWKIDPWSPLTAETLFLERFRELWPRS